MKNRREKNVSVMKLVLENLKTEGPLPDLGLLQDPTRAGLECGQPASKPGSLGTREVGKGANRNLGVMALVLARSLKDTKEEDEE